MKIEKPRGTRDFLPQEMEKRRHIENLMRKVAESFGYREIQTPTFEHLELFTLKSGEGIVEEIYAFKDKGGRDLALRPELTAPVMRMFVNECSVMPRPLRFYYFGNCFRYERPQRGRYREFWQFGVELIGSDKPESDAEVIYLAYRILKELGVDFRLHVGHVGLLRKVLQDLDSADAAMRLIDKKDFDGLKVLLNECGKSDLFETVVRLSECGTVEEAKEVYPEFDYSHVEKVSEILTELGVEFSLDFGIARGLDYYTGIVFEVYAEGLGAQKQICGGGSYRLARLFGGEDVPSTGFAIGFDRVVEVCSAEMQKRPVAVVVSFGDFVRGQKVAELLRAAGIDAVVDVMGRNVRKQLSFANSINADYAIFAGEEFEKGIVRIKDLRTEEQIDVDVGELESFFENGKT
ncbi:histidine--tRNA ligase [Geoglobus acetivorans]|uniref:Histidine--tRNA ligase n=1 Tax=Geoglobus acetivorans TaxID=565033 RepID=A0ABZ3H8D8_GEOAI|nr:histidine--tRNA ligase [Geoglobus acetivorans]